MNVLGIESSCDECSVAVVRDGKEILSNVVATQIEIHRPYDGVVPELASRTHTEWIRPVTEEALTQSGMKLGDIDGIAVTSRPGLVGSLLVGLSFAKGLAFSQSIPFVGIDHIRAHLYAPHLEYEIEYPYIGVIVSGGHTIISVVSDFDTIDIKGTTIDDACGEAFDKVAKHYGFGFPGGLQIDKLSQKGDPEVYRFPDPSLHKGEHRYDVSYSGLKTAVINQLDSFKVKDAEFSPADLAASFQKTAIDLLLRRIYRVVEDFGIHRVVVGGGVAANSYFRAALADFQGADCTFPSLKLCTDNGAMIAGLGYHYLARGEVSSLSHNAAARVPGFRQTYP